MKLLKILGNQILDKTIKFTKLQDFSALSILGRSANSTGVPASITATAASDAVLRESGSVIGFGTIATAGIANDAVTYAKIQNVSASRINGRGSAGGSGDMEELSVGAGLTISGTTVDAPQLVQTTTLTGTQNDFAQTTARRLLLRCNNASALTLSGFVAGADGDVIDVASVGAGQVNFAHQNAGSTAANRLVNFVTSGNTPLAAGVGAARFIYDATTARWRLVDHEQGAWITPTFAAGDYTSVGGGTVTVASGDVARNAYWVKGRSMHWQLVINTFSYSTPGYGVVITIPGGFSAATTIANLYTVRVGNNSSTTVVARAAHDIATNLTVRVDMIEGAATAWTASTDASYIRFSDVVELT